MKAHGTGSIYKRGSTFWVKLYVDGQPVYHSSKSTKKADAVSLLEKLISQRHRGEISGRRTDRILINELLDDVLKSDVEESTRYVWELVVRKSLRPFFGKIKAARLTTDKMKQYRAKRLAEGCTDATANRELSILRTAFHNGRKVTPPKVIMVPYFPMTRETTIRTGFLNDEQYVRLRDALPQELKALFVCSFMTGIRRSELLNIQWWQVDFEQELILLNDTKNGQPRTVPIVPGDMRDLLWESFQQAKALWPNSPWVFSRSGKQIKGFTKGWRDACAAAGVPGLLLHDLRRTAVRNMRNAGVPQVIRMKISGHKTDSMERRYNITDLEDIANAKALMADRLRAVTTVTKT